MEPIDQLKHQLEQRIDTAKSHEKNARRASDSGLMLIHRARAAAFKEILALLDKLTVDQP